MHSRQTDNDHIPVEVVGWCKGIKRGSHTITARVSKRGGPDDCYTGWTSNDYMEVWEPTSAEQSTISYMQRFAVANGVDTSGSLLSHRFKKRSPSTGLRILFYDILRVIGSASGKWCRWEVKVDGKSCPVPLAGSLHTN